MNFGTDIKRYLMVLVDSSIWIDFFKGKDSALPLLELIDRNNICLNDIILAELTPSIVYKNEMDLLEILSSVTKLGLKIDWNQITSMQITNLKSGIHKVGIPDLIILQNAIQNDVELFSMDKHFFLMEKVHGFKMYPTRQSGGEG